jgi:thiosulfate reductase cytochrome b subunit
VPAEGPGGQILNSSRQHRTLIHPLPIRIFHWLNAIVLLVMVTTGWQIYNASPLFPFKFPKMITLGNWLAGGLQLHFAAMWLLLANLFLYGVYGIFSGRFRRSFFPLSALAMLHDFRAGLRRQLPHTPGRYNMVQKAAYILVLLAIILTIASGFAIWKPVQLQQLTALMGGYDRARYVHFAGMAFICCFTVGHVVLALLVPKTVLLMVLGWSKSESDGGTR